MNLCANIPLLVTLLTGGLPGTYAPVPRVRAYKVVRAACRYYKKGPLLLLSVLAKETEFNPNKCYHGAHGIGQVQLKPHNCRRTKKLALRLGLYKIGVNVRKVAQLLRFWQKYCRNHHHKYHSWILHYNQGMGHCPSGLKKCSRKQRVPITKGWVGGYAKRVLAIKRKFLLRINVERAKFNGNHVHL